MNHFANICQSCGKKEFGKYDVKIMLEMNLCCECFEKMMLTGAPVLEYDTGEDELIKQ